MYTFKSKSTRCTSVIDYFLCSCSLGELVECIVFDENDNLSDHRKGSLPTGKLYQGGKTR